MLQARWRSPAAAGLFILCPLLLGVLLYSPLFGSGVPNTADGLLHLYRTVLWRDGWADGILWPRWHTLLYQGYGYPLFVFYAPLLYAVGAAAAAISDSVDVGLKAALFFTCLAYPLGIYLWARDIFGRLGAVVAATAWTFAAFRFRELFLQGNYAQFAAWAVYPWLFFTWRRLAVAPSRAAFLGAVLALAVLLLLHNISAMLVAPALALYVIWQAIENRSSRPWLRLALAGACALLIGLSFWLPALGESGLTRVQVLTRGYFDVVGHFITPEEMLAPVTTIDGRAANPTMPYNAGRLTIVLALAGALSLFKPGTPRLERGHLVFAALGTATAAFMMLEPSLVVWRTVPYIAFAEFPSRMYGIGSVFAAMLAGASLRWLVGRRALAIATLVCVFGLILEVAPYQFPRAFLPVKATIAEFRAYEDEYGAPGTTSASEYLSQWTTQVPRSPAVDRDGARQALVDAPPGVSAVVADVAAHSLTILAHASAPARVALAQFYFPGWAATVDGEEVALAPCTPAGLICLHLPAGDSHIELTYRGTRLQHAAAWLGLLGLAATVLATIFVARRPTVPTPGGVDAGEADGVTSPSDGDRAIALALIALVVTLLVAKVAWIAPHTTLFRMSSPRDQVLPAQHKADLPVGPALRLAGWDLPSENVRAGGRLRLRLYWQADAQPDAEYSSFAHLVGGPDQREYAGLTTSHPGNIPTTTWNPDFYIIDDLEIEIPAQTPPILYTLRVGLSPRGSQQRTGEQDLSPRVRVLPAADPRSREATDRLGITFPNGARLLDYEVGEIGAGESVLPLTLLWKAGEPISGEPQIFLHVLDESGAVIAQADGASYGGLYTVGDWLPGEVVRDERLIPLPAGALPAAVLVGLYDLDTQQRMPVTTEGGAEVKDGAVRLPLNPAP